MEGRTGTHTHMHTRAHTHTDTHTHTHTHTHTQTHTHTRYARTPRSTNTIGAVMRVRNALAFATHAFFQGRGFYYVHTPIITASDCEGAGEMFAVRVCVRVCVRVPVCGCVFVCLCVQTLTADQPTLDQSNAHTVLCCR